MESTQIRKSIRKFTVVKNYKHFEVSEIEVSEGGVGLPVREYQLVETGQHLERIDCDNFAFPGKEPTFTRLRLVKTFDWENIGKAISNAEDKICRVDIDEYDPAAALAVVAALPHLKIRVFRNKLTCNYLFVGDENFEPDENLLPIKAPF